MDISYSKAAVKAIAAVNYHAPKGTWLVTAQ